MPVISFSGRKGEAGNRAASTSSSLVERTPSTNGRIIRFNLKLGTDILVPSGSPWEETALSIPRVAWAGARRGGGLSLQPSLFTRLAEVEAELVAMKNMLAELKVNQDELRRDRDEWRWRAERLLADLQQGTWWRWCNRTAAALDAITASFCKLLADMQDKLAEMTSESG